MCGEGRGHGAGLLGFGSCLFPPTTNLLAVCLWASFLTDLCQGFIIYKMRRIIVSVSQGCND